MEMHTLKNAEDKKTQPIAQWIVDEAAGDEMLLSFGIEREKLITDMAANGGRSVDEQLPLHDVYKRINERRRELGIE